jgi:hypothetical protein
MDCMVHILFRRPRNKIRAVFLAELSKGIAVNC